MATNGKRYSISVCVIAQNNEGIIRRCLDSCTWANEIILVDGGSTDATVEIAREYGARVYMRPYDFSAHQYNYGAARADSDWVFVVDSDEVITPQLAEEIQQLLGGPQPPYSAYKVPRKLIDHGQWLPCCGTYPDSTVRLFAAGQFAYALARVHAGGLEKERYGVLRHPLLHYSFADLADHIARMNRHTTRAALDAYDRGRRPGYAYLLARFCLGFWYEYLVRGGIRHGVPGLMYSVVRATEVFTKYAKVWELANGTSAIDLESETARKQAADRSILEDEKQPDFLRQHAAEGKAINQ